LRAARDIPRAAAARRRVAARHVLALLAATFVIGAPATASGDTPGTAPGSIGLRLLDAPAAAGQDPRARSYIVDHLAPGTTIERRIEISNTTTSTAHVVLYPSAAEIVKGSFLGAVGHTPNEVSTWTSVSPEKLDVPAHGEATATVTIRVPKNAARSEHYGVVWAETRSAPAGDEGITQVSRVGIRLYLSIGPGGAPAADFTIESLTAERSTDGQPIVVASVHNSGGRALDMNGSLELLNGPGGLAAGPFPATLGTTLAIGDTQPVTIILDAQIPAGPWDAEIALQSGLLERTAEASITFPQAGASVPVALAPPRPGWLYPAIGGLGAGLFGLLGKLVQIRLRRPRVDRYGKPVVVASTGTNLASSSFVSGQPTRQPSRRRS
jgi:hypothetical protein